MIKFILLAGLIILCLSGYYFINYKLLASPLSQAKVVGLGLVKVGDLLEHPKFGIGSVKSIRSLEEANDFIFTIKFSNVGKKHLIASAANLKYAKK